MDCPDCGRTFTAHRGLKRHQHGACPKRKCVPCKEYFPSPVLLVEHQRKCNLRSVCELCTRSFTRRSDMLHHQRTTCKNRKGPATVKVECEGCRHSYSSQKNLNRHKRLFCPARKMSRYNCDKCSHSYPSKECLYQHMQRHIRIEKAPVRCSDCNEVMPERLLLKHKQEECVNRNRVGGPVYKKPRLLPQGVKVAKTAFNKMLTNYEIENNNETTDLIVFLEAQRYTVQEIIKHDLFVKNAIKMNMALQITIENVAGEVSPWAFRTSNVEIYLATPINGIITDMFEKIKQKFSERLLDGSGCKLSTIEKLLVRTSKNNPLRSPFLKPYIKLNTDMRKKASNNFDKDFFKLMNNAVYGKTMENVRKRMDLEGVTDATRLAKCVANIYFKDRVIYSEKMSAIHYHKKKVVLDKPTYVGMAILDISKTLMYDFHYGTMLPTYGNKLSLLYMDTDSFIYEIRTEDFYKDMEEFAHKMDTSDYPINHPLYNEKNKKVLGMFKDESNPAIVTKFIGLRAKMYCIENDGKTTKKAKGVKTSALQKQITSDNYEQCLSTMSANTPSRHYKIGTVLLNKLSLSGFDDKRHIRVDKVNTYAHRHYRILLKAIKAQIASEEAAKAAEKYAKAAAEAAAAAKAIA
ncbi:hypothetical protein B566_EDAN017335 [Ephemera danica]|nr:hypothetical protein B566_EDAN017335 [Ephemera danica]